MLPLRIVIFKHTTGKECEFPVSRDDASAATAAVVAPRSVHLLRVSSHPFTMLARSVKSLQVTGVKVSTRSFVSSNINNGSYSEEQAKKGRPISPHVNIYKFPPAALTSITNRVTGVLLSVGKKRTIIDANPLGFSPP